MLNEECPQSRRGRSRTGWVPSGQARRQEQWPYRRPEAVAAVGLAPGCEHVERMDEGPRRARTHNQQEVAQHQRQRLFFGASEWRCGPKVARQSDVPGHQAAKGRTRPEQ